MCVRRLMCLSVSLSAVQLELIMINPLREGKRLLVLDIDYTIFYCKSQAPIEGGAAMLIPLLLFSFFPPHRPLTCQ